MNEVLKTKWLCRYVAEDDALWKKWLYTKIERIVLGGGVRRALMHSGVVVGNLSMQGWIFLGLLYVLRREMGLGCCFGMISGGGNNLLKFNFQIFLEWHAWEMLQCMSYYLIMGLSLSGILPSQEAWMIGKRKTFSIYYLYLQIWMWMFMLKEKRLFGLLNPREPSLLRVYVRGCLGPMVLTFRQRQFGSPKLIWKLVSLLRDIRGQGSYRGDA